MLQFFCGKKPHILLPLFSFFGVYVMCIDRFSFFFFCVFCVKLNSINIQKTCFHQQQVVPVLEPYHNTHNIQKHSQLIQTKKKTRITTFNPKRFKIVGYLRMLLENQLKIKNDKINFISLEMNLFFSSHFTFRPFCYKSVGVSNIFTTFIFFFRFRK